MFEGFFISFFWILIIECVSYDFISCFFAYFKYINNGRLSNDLPPPFDFSVRRVEKGERERDLHLHCSLFIA